MIYIQTKFILNKLLTPKFTFREIHAILRPISGLPPNLSYIVRLFHASSYKMPSKNRQISFTWIECCARRLFSLLRPSLHA